MKKLQRLSLARAAMMLLMMLTTVTAWGFKTETTIYSVSLNGDHYFNIYDGSSTTASWAAEAQYVQSENITYYYWKADVSHNLANGMTIETNADVQTSSVTSEGIHTTGSTKFTFKAPNSIAITSVEFMNNSSAVSATYSGTERAYEVTLANGTTFTGFYVTFGYISGFDWSDADPSQPTYSMAYDQGIRSYYIGAFERIGQGASLAPFRACLTYSGNGNLPEEILVRFGSGHGDFTAIGTLNTSTGEISTGDWFDLNGHKLQAKPTTKGVYINNGRKVVVK